MEFDREKQHHDEDDLKARLKVNVKSAGVAKNCVLEAIRSHGWDETSADGEGEMIYTSNENFDEHFDILSTRKDVVYSRIPWFGKIASKSALTDLLLFMARFYPSDYNFIPRTYVLPREMEEWKRIMDENPDKTWILKPSSGSCGNNICLVNDYSEVLEQMNEGTYVIQTYIEKPLLLDNKKFDLRLYLALYGVDTMHAFLYEDGLGRICTYDYEEPTSSNKSNVFMHLTNYSLNLKSEEFAKKGRLQGNKDLKKKLSEIYNKIEAEQTDGVEIVQKIKNQIASICNKVVSAFHANVAHNVDCAIKLESSWFHIVGVDIMLDSEYNAWFIEINKKPGINLCSKSRLFPGQEGVPQVDKEINVPMVSDVLELADIYRRDPLSIERISTYKGLSKVYSNSINKPNTEFSVLHNSKSIYDALACQKGGLSLSVAQFSSLLRVSTENSKLLLREDDFIEIFSSIVGRNGTSLSFEEFPSALYQLFIKSQDLGEDAMLKTEIDQQFPRFLNTTLEQVNLSV